jgi:hypothetical protein
MIVHGADARAIRPDVKIETYVYQLRDRFQKAVKMARQVAGAYGQPMCPRTVRNQLQDQNVCVLVCHSEVTPMSNVVVPDRLSLVYR